MMKARLSTFTVLLAGGLFLSGCDTLQTGMNDGYASVKQAMQNFRPLEKEQQSPSSAETTTETAAADCPTVRIVQDLDRVYQFTDDANPAPSQSVSSIRMTGVQDRCSLVQDNMVIDMTLAFEGMIGPKARAQAGDKPGFAYPYFIAITNNQGSIIAKEVFAVTLAYESGRDSETHVEQVRQMIPLTGLAQNNYKVLIGFQLSEEELAYNRALPPEQKQAQPEDAASQIEPAAGKLVETEIMDGKANE